MTPSGPLPDAAGTDDDTAETIYAAEDRVADRIGARLHRWADVEAFVENALALDALADAFPNLAGGIDVGRRSRNATASVALWSDRLILIRDGSWNTVTICHELAHLACPPDEGHGPRFVAAEVEIVRLCCGIVAAAELASEFAAASVPIGPAPS